MTSPETAMVFVIDDDAAVREAIQGLLKSVGLRSDSFGTVVAGAAARLGLNRSTLNARMRKLEIRRPQPV